MTTDPKLEEVLTYLKTEFPGSTFSVSQDPDHPVLVRITAPSKEHYLYIERDFFGSKTPDEIGAALAQYRVAAVLKDLGKFPLALSKNGCIIM